MPWKFRIRAPPEWGIDPVPREYKILRGIDFFVLWSSLGVGLLVLVAGSLLVPSLGLRDALAISIVGSLIGSILLASAGLIGSKYSVPTMVSLRPILGKTGSYLPTALNVIQLVGWTAFELMIMGIAATNVSGPILGSEMATRIFWTVIFAVWCAALAIGGPLVVVRKWLERVAIWLVYFSAIWITAQIFTHSGVWDLFAMPGDGSLPISLALDLVIAMPISWWPLISDYNRFSSTGRGGFLGTFLGYTISNTWFYFLGAALVMVMGIKDIVSSIAALFLGNLALIFILVDETDNCFADIYSTAVSIQNAAPKVRQWKLVMLTTVIGLVLALTIPLTEYEWFLLMIGGLFVPLLGVLVSEYLIREKAGGFEILEFYEKAPKISFRPLFSWFAGIAIYFLIARYIPELGASIPSFALSASLNLILRILKKGG
ncbi:MAG: cytosine permease [Nitrososphaerota archaeon]|nr:cytosine permease [Nitrososphaerota archaeon]